MKDPTISYQEWQTEKTPERLSQVVDDLKPVWMSVLGKENSAMDPYLRGQAKLIVADAVETYDPANPAGASLSTWTGHQLRQLSRKRRLQSQTTRLPERVQLDRWNLEKAKLEMQDELGRDPTVDELADRTTFSKKRITEIQRMGFSTPSEAAFEGQVPHVQKTDYDEEALEYVYEDSDNIDKKILEHTLGYGGQKVLSNAELMAKLKLDPTTMTRRRQRLTHRINKVLEMF